MPDSVAGFSCLLEVGRQGLNESRDEGSHNKTKLCLPPDKIVLPPSRVRVPLEVLSRILTTDGRPGGVKFTPCIFGQHACPAFCFTWHRGTVAQRWPAAGLQWCGQPRETLKP